MASTFTVNLGVEQPALGDYAGHWSDPVNSDWSLLDQATGTTTTVALTNANVTLDVAQSAFFLFLCSGTLTGNIELIFPGAIGGRRIIVNNTTGAFTLKVLNGSGDTGGGVLVPQGTITPVILTAGAAAYEQPPIGNLSQLPAIGTLTALGNVTGGTAPPTALSKTQLTTLVNNFTSSLSGAVPASSGGTSTFLRADGTFATPSAHGQCYFSMTSSSVVTLAPTGGNLVTISGVNYQIPSGGVASTINSCFINGTSGQTLTAATLYYAYVFNNSGTLAIDFSTTAYTKDTTAGNVGVLIKTGDNTRTLVGLVYPQSGPVFTAGLVLSWFNKSLLQITTNFSVDRHTTSGSFTEINSEIRANFLVWSGQGVTAAINGTVANTGGSQAVIATALGFDTTSTASNGFSQSTVAGTAPVLQSGIGIFITVTLSEGFHFATLLGNISASQATWPGGSTPGTTTTLNVSFWG